MAVRTGTSHWDTVWATKTAGEVSWYQEVPERSLRLIEAIAVPPWARIVDVGGGACTLVDHLLARGHGDLWVLDIAAAPLLTARRRCGDPWSVHWTVADVREWRPAVIFDVWHDRAVFHFMVEPADQARYVQTMRRCLAPGGHAVIATFATDGPDSCSGLPAARYDPDGLAAALGPDFIPVEFHRELHQAPAGSTQSFLYGRFQRMAS